jgi:hypothetical protein
MSGIWRECAEFSALPAKLGNHSWLACGGHWDEPMAEDAEITDIKQVLAEIRALRGRAVGPRPARRPLLWAASVEIRGKLCRGLVVELARGGLRLRFAAEAETAEEVMSVIDQFDGFGSKVIWQYDGEAGVHFLAAPEEIATLIRAGAAAKPTDTARRSLAPAAGR